MAEAHRCLCLTRQGQRCRKPSFQGSPYCYQHQGCKTLWTQETQETQGTQSVSNFDLLDDYVILEMIQQMIDHQQFKTLANWMKTNRRFRRLGQQRLDRYCQEVRTQPPTRIGSFGQQMWYSRWATTSRL